MPNPRLYPARSGTPNEYEVIASAQIIGRITSSVTAASRGFG